MLDSFLNAVPPYLVSGLFLSWIVWSKYFNDGKLGIKDAYDLTTFLRVFILITSIFVAGIFVIFLTLILFKTSIFEAQNLMLNLVNGNVLLWLYILSIYFIVMYGHNDKKQKFKKEKLEDWLISPYWIVIPALFLIMTIATYISAYKSAVNSYFSVSIFSMLIIWLIYDHCSSLFERKEHFSKKLLSKKEYRILIVGIILLGLLFGNILFPKTTITSENTKYIVHDSYHLTIFVQNQINHTINNLGINFPLTMWIPLNYNDIDIENIPNNHFFNRWTNVIFYYDNNTVRQISLSKYIEDEKFINGLRYIETSESTNELIFELDRSKLKYVKVIALTGLKEGDNDKIFKIKRYDDYLKNEEIRRLTTTFVNNVTAPIIVDDLLLFNLKNNANNKFNCDLETANVNIDNNLKTISCDEKNVCSFGYNSQNNYYRGQIYLHDKTLLMLNTNKFQFNKFDLEINVSCN